MHTLNQDQLSTISGGTECEVVITASKPDEDNFFEFCSSISGECDPLRNDFENSVFHKKSVHWVDLGYEVSVEFHEL